MFLNVFESIFFPKNLCVLCFYVFPISIYVFGKHMPKSGNTPSVDFAHFYGLVVCANIMRFSIFLGVIAISDSRPKFHAESENRGLRDVNCFFHCPLADLILGYFTAKFG